MKGVRALLLLLIAGGLIVVLSSPAHASFPGRMVALLSYRMAKSSL